MGVYAVRRVDEDDRSLPLQFLPQRREVRVAEVVVVAPVAGVEAHAVRFQILQRVADFRQSGIQVFERVRDRGEEAVFCGFLGDEGGAVFVTLAGEFYRGFAVEDLRSGCCDGENAGGDGVVG